MGLLLGMERLYSPCCRPAPRRAAGPWAGLGRAALGSLSRRCGSRVLPALYGPPGCTCVARSDCCTFLTLGFHWRPGGEGGRSVDHIDRRPNTNRMWSDERARRGCPLPRDPPCSEECRQHP